MVANVHKLMPEAKIVFIMRNPIERAWTRALIYFDKIEGRLIDRVTEEELRKFRGDRSSLRRDYLRTLENWGAYYPKEPIFMGFLEDMHFYPNHLLRRLCRFLWVDPSGKYRVIRRKIHSSDVKTMPTRLAAHLAEIYLEGTRRLEERFGATNLSGSSASRGSSRTRGRRSRYPTRFGSHRCGRSGGRRWIMDWRRVLERQRRRAVHSPRYKSC